MSPPPLDAWALPPGVAMRDQDVEVVGGDLRVVDAGPDWIEGVADSLRASREALLGRRAADIAAVLGGVGARFADPGDPVRTRAVALLPAESGLSADMSAAVVDGMAADWTAERLTSLLRHELGDPCPLDGFVSRPSGRLMAVGPALSVQILSGSVPGVGVSALLRSLLVKSPTLLKPGRGDVVLPVLFARALADADPDLAAAVAVVYWPGGSQGVAAAALGRADLVTAYGSDETVGELRARAPITARFVAYHHRTSVGIVGRGALTPSAVGAAAQDVAAAVGFFDQRGCVCPQVVYVEEGGDVAPQDFAEEVARALAALEARLPGGPPGTEEWAALHQFRAAAELMEGDGTARLLHGGEAPWTVILEGPAGGPVPPAAGRVVRLRPIADADEVLSLLRASGPHLQTVGTAGLGDRAERLAGALGVVGASRVVPFAEVPFPPPWWHHDGRGPLTDLLRWVDMERS